MKEKLIRWLIAKYLPGFHLHKDPGERRRKDGITRSNRDGDGNQQIDQG